MIDLILDWARNAWAEWFGIGPVGLTTAVLAGGPAHRNRFALFVFDHRDRSPRAFIKTALDATERGFVEGEAAAVRSLENLELPGLAAVAPKLLGNLAIGDAYAAAYRTMAGKRLVVPEMIGRVGIVGRRSMARFWEMTSDFGIRLAASTYGANDYDERALGERVEMFLSWFKVEGRIRRELDGFRQALERETIRWHPSWQHGDLAVGNVLLRHGDLQLVDWEAAGNDYEPWFDLTTAPAATVILACRQTGRPPAIVALPVLSDKGWTGTAMSGVLRKRWTHPFPIGWAVTLTTMHMALRRAAENRAMPSDYVGLVSLLAADSAIRSAASWAVP